MKKTILASEQEISVYHVRLPVVFGLRPSTYIVPLYLFLLFLLMFCFTILPSILHPGSHVRFTSNIAGASVFLDGIRIGASPLDHYLSPGTHSLEYRYKYLNPIQIKLDKSIQIIGSLFDYAREDIHVDLSMTDSEGFLTNMVQEFSRWCLVSEELETYQIPPILVEQISIYLATNSTIDLRLLESAFIACVPHIGSPSQLEDWLKAWQLAMGTNSDQLAHQILDRYEIETKSELKNICDLRFPGAEWSKKQTNNTPYRFEGQKSIARRSFSQFTDGTSIFFVDDNEADELLFAEFLTDHPEWALDSNFSLVQENLVESAYLSLFAAKEAEASQAIREVSYYAVQAFLKWFSLKKIPLAMKKSGYRAVLPALKQWKACYQAINNLAGNGPWLSSEFNSNFSQERGILRHFTGGVFEWAESSASLFQSDDPNDRLACQRFPGFQRHLLGGGMSVREADFSIHDQYAYPNKWCGEVTGFRIWLLKE